MTTDLQRAEALMSEFSHFCDSAMVVSANAKHFQYRVARKSVKNPSALFSNDEPLLYPFDHWAAIQTDIKWSAGAKSKFWIGYLKDGTKVTIVVEK